jgi:predicted N-acyltransferase
MGALPAYFFGGEGIKPYNHFELFIEPTCGAAANRAEWFPALLGGTRAGYANEVLLAPHLTAEEGGRVSASILRALFRMADVHQVRSVAFMYLNSQGVRDVGPHLGPDSRLLLTDADTFLDVSWSTFDEYLRWLTANRRRSAKREIRQFHGSGFKVSIGKLSEWYEEAGPLLSNLMNRYGARLTPEQMTRYLANQAAVLDDESVVFLCHQSGNLVGFSLFYDWAGTLYGRVCGLDYDRAGSNAEYFNLAYYLPIRYAIEQGLRSIRFGIKSYDAKLMRGAKLEPLWSAITASSSTSPQWRDALVGWNETEYGRWNELYGSLAGGLPEAQWLAASASVGG